MKRVDETELRDYISKEQFETLKDKLDQAIGNAKVVKRLAIQAADFEKQNLDTRIRITNGHAEILQKVGAWENQTRQEVGISLPNDPKVILGHWVILSNILDGSSVQKYLMQMNNYIYLTSDYEFKITHQFGGEDAYSFEIESLGKELDLSKIAHEYGLEPKELSQDPKYWEDFNKRVNLNTENLNEVELLDIISSYC